jgi:hypothetical protein
VPVRDGVQVGLSIATGPRAVPHERDWREGEK